MNKILSPKSSIIMIVLLIVAVYCFSCSKPAKQEASQVDYYTCSMHPEVKEKDPGKCPICNMDLTPVMKKAAADSQKVEAPVEQ